jgi:excinuclease ABC subunit A
MPRPKLNPPAPVNQQIEIRGARQNNLKNLNLDLPLGRLIVVTGPSGSGKSSLAFDTVYAEGQRRYVETFSPYTRQFLDRMDRPDVDEIRGIPPAIAIEQSNQVKTSRSTVGTITEINDYLKLLFPRIAKGYCPECEREVRPETAKSIAAAVEKLGEGRDWLMTFETAVPPSASAEDFFSFLQRQGYLRLLIEGKVVRTDEKPPSKRLPAAVRVIQDRIRVAKSGESRSRLHEAVERAIEMGKDRLCVIDPGTGEAHPFSTGWHCAYCDRDIRPPSPGLFSFNNPLGACPACRGFGRVIGIDYERALPDRRLSIREGVVKPFQSESAQECQKDLMRHAQRQGIDVDVPFDELPAKAQEYVILGDRSNVDLTGEEIWENDGWYGVKGFFDWLESKTYKMHVRVFLSRYRSYTKCRECNGGRFQPETLNYKVPVRKGVRLTLPDLAGMPVDKLLEELEQIKPSDTTAEMLCKEVCTRLRYLCEVGVGYLTLDRSTRTLSGGEVERVNLTSCLGASLVNSLFVLDEPSVGLHPRDIGRLTKVMHELRDKGNTLLVVEHEESVMRAADQIVDLGPGRGETGGDLVFQGNLKELATRDTLTAKYLLGRQTIPVPSDRRTPRRYIRIRKAEENNLKKIDVKIPLGLFTCVTGVSGSGKSTLVHDVLYQNILRHRGHIGEKEPGRCAGVDGDHVVDAVVMVDQAPLSRTPRSTPAVYVGVFEKIRQLFADHPESKTRGFTASTFSFNSGNGRCERCSGNGFEKVEMQFLSDVYLRCPECEGKRFQPQVLRIRVRDHSIHDVLELTVTEAVRFFEDEGEAFTKPLQVLVDVGLGYLRLGQPLNTLSGGESQRLKLVGHLVEKERKDSSLLIFDEPTTGLHFDDVAQLVRVFQRLVDQGNTLVVIEHNMEVVKCADHVIDLGPDAGDRGGQVVAAGTPEQIAQCEESHTGRFLREVLDPDRFRKAARVAQAPAAYGNGRAPRRNEIRVFGAREHNLKNLHLEIPRDKMVIVTGLSGSGKSTLAFDILFNEGQRRFLDSMSPYARQFVEQMEKPDVDLIDGLPPTVAIEQRLTRGGGKSTVATVTEVYHFLRLLFSKLGTQHCPHCGVPVEKQSAAAIVKKVEALARKGRTRVLAPLIKARKGFHTDIARWAEGKGYESLLVDGKFVPVEGFQKLERYKEHTIDVLIGEVGPRGSAERLVRAALEHGKGTARVMDSRNVLHVLSTEMSCPDCGMAFEPLDPRLFSFNSPHGWCETCRGFGQVWGYSPSDRDGETEIERELHEERAFENADEAEGSICPDCEGARLNAVARHVKLRGMTITDFTRASVRQAGELSDKFKFSGTEAVVASGILPEIRQRLKFMEKVGLEYLTLDRSATTLSGGESQRIRLAAQLGSNLRGVLYVLDEPTIGLHPRDNLALLETLEVLKSKGNSLLVVEHDDETMRRADRIIDLGPGAGVRGGQLVATGTLDEIVAHPESITGRYLREPMAHPLRGERRPLDSSVKWLKLNGASANNLKGINVKFPLQRLTVITGVSGSGKSSLMRGVLMPALNTRNRRATPGQPWHSIEGKELISSVYEVDQSPIGKTSRSTPATYVKVLDEIRKLYAGLPVSRMRGYTASRFSFNSEGGRCEVCQGQGVIKLEMNFLPASYIPCEDCGGKRFNPQTLEVLYNDMSIGDVMDMTIEQAANFFAAHPRIQRPLALLADTGLGYLRLGQPSPTLSGGEAQRLKLVTQLKRGVGRAAEDVMRGRPGVRGSVYLLEEPTIGLHMADVARLLDVLHRLVDEGHTVILIEHNTDVIAEADYLIEIGPEAGDRGGRLVGCGSPEEIVKLKSSRIAPFLKTVLR